MITERLNLRTVISLSLLWTGVIFSILGCSPFSSMKQEQNPYPAGIANDAGLVEGVHGVVVKLKNEELLSGKESGHSQICFLGINDTHGQEVPELSEEVRSYFRNKTQYTLVEQSRIDAALERSGVKRNDMFIPEERQKWISALETDFDYILSAYIVQTGNPDRGVPASETVNFEIYNVKDNSISRVRNQLRGIYSMADAKKKKFLGIF